jgi:hypothetical protein
MLTYSISEKNRNTEQNIVHNIVHNNKDHINLMDWIDRAKAKRETKSRNPKRKINSQYCQLCKVYTLHTRDQRYPLNC